MLTERELQMREKEQRSIPKYAVRHPVRFSTVSGIVFFIWLLVIQRLSLTISGIVGVGCFLLQLFIWHQNGPGPRHERKYWRDPEEPS